MLSIASLKLNDATAICGQELGIVLSVREEWHTLSPSDTTQLWASVSSFVRKCEDSVFLRVCHATADIAGASV